MNNAEVLQTTLTVILSYIKGENKMKKKYTVPTVVSSDKNEGVIPVGLAGAVGLLAGYAATRAVVNASRVTTMIAKKRLLKEGTLYADV